MFDIIAYITHNIILPIPRWFSGNELFPLIYLLCLCTCPAMHCTLLQMPSHTLRIKLRTVPQQMTWQSHSHSAMTCRYPCGIQRALNIDKRFSNSSRKFRGDRQWNFWYWDPGVAGKCGKVLFACSLKLTCNYARISLEAAAMLLKEAYSRRC